MNPTELITALIDDGMKEHEIASAIGTTQATINRIKRGTIAKPNYEIVAGLIRLHNDRKAAEKSEAA